MQITFRSASHPLLLLFSLDNADHTAAVSPVVSPAQLQVQVGYTGNQPPLPMTDMNQGEGDGPEEGDEQLRGEDDASEDEAAPPPPKSEFLGFEGYGNVGHFDQSKYRLDKLHHKMS